MRDEGMRRSNRLRKRGVGVLLDSKLKTHNLNHVCFLKRILNFKIIWEIKRFSYKISITFGALFTHILSLFFLSFGFIFILFVVHYQRYTKKKGVDDVQKSLGTHLLFLSSDKCPFPALPRSSRGKIESFDQFFPLTPKD